MSEANLNHFSLGFETLQFSWGPDASIVDRGEVSTGAGKDSKLLSMRGRLRRLGDWGFLTRR